jgi:UDP-GlcNAc:undecaprenyl-phosphate/decaprenyl-phosphate GlcNAc-1-phosphate transferase
MEERDFSFLAYILFFVSSVLFSFLVNRLFLKFSSNLGTRNSGSENLIRWSSQAKPSLGGLSFFILFLLSIIFYLILFNEKDNHLDNQLLGIIASCTLAFIMGLSDDAYNTKPVLKFVIQIICGIILIVTGTYIQLFSNIYLNYFLTIFWIIGIMNSINMLDNMDAITTVTSITIIINALFMILFNSNYNAMHVILLLGVMAALIGFLFFNWHPAKMYMGDTGSQFLGIFLGAMGIIYFWNAPDAQNNIVQTKQILITLLAFIIPIIDTTSVVINRIMSGRSPFVGGKDHTTHCLYFIGFTEKNIARLYFILGILSVGFNFFIFNITANWDFFYIILFSLYCLLLFVLLYLPTRKYGR